MVNKGLHDHLCNQCAKRFQCLRRPIGCDKPFLAPCLACRGIDAKLKV
jgi:hypothetical protein